MALSLDSGNTDNKRVFLCPDSLRASIVSSPLTQRASVSALGHTKYFGIYEGTFFKGLEPSVTQQQTFIKCLLPV